MIGPHRQSDDDLDAEQATLVTHSDDATTQREQQPKYGLRRWMLRRWMPYVLTGGVAMAGALLLLHVAASPGVAVSSAVHAPKPEQVTVRELLESPEAVSILMDNAISAGRMDFSAKESMQATFAYELHGTIEKLKSESPEDSHRLSKLLSPEEQQAGLRSLRSMGDSRMLKIQKGIMTAIKDTVQKSGDHELLKRHLVENLRPHVSLMRQLRDLYFPEHVDGPLDQGFDLQTKDLNDVPLVKHFDELVPHVTAELDKGKGKDVTVAPSRKLQIDLSQFVSFDEMKAGIAALSSSSYTPDYDFFSDDDFNAAVSEIGMDDEAQFDQPYDPRKDNLFLCSMKALFTSTTQVSDCFDVATSFVQTMFGEKVLGITTTTQFNVFNAFFGN